VFSVKKIMLIILVISMLFIIACSTQEDLTEQEIIDNLNLLSDNELDAALSEDDGAIAGLAIKDGKDQNVRTARKQSKGLTWLSCLDMNDGIELTFENKAGKEVTLDVSNKCAGMNYFAFKCERDSGKYGKVTKSCDNGCEKNACVVQDDNGKVKIKGFKKAKILKEKPIKAEEEEEEEEGKGKKDKGKGEEKDEDEGQVPTGEEEDEIVGEDLPVDEGQAPTGEEVIIDLDGDDDVDLTFDFGIDQVVTIEIEEVELGFVLLDDDESVDFTGDEDESDGAWEFTEDQQLDFTVIDVQADDKIGIVFRPFLEPATTFDGGAGDTNERLIIERDSERIVEEERAVLEDEKRLIIEANDEASTTFKADVDDERLIIAYLERDDVRQTITNDDCMDDAKTICQEDGGEYTITIDAGKLYLDGNTLGGNTFDADGGKDQCPDQACRDGSTVSCTLDPRSEECSCEICPDGSNRK
jgi:hypothetical protein